MNPPPGYPIHWIFDYFDVFTPNERNVALLLFDGKRVREIASALDLTPATVEQCLCGIGDKVHWTIFMNRKGIESGRFHRKWGFIRRDKGMDDPAF